MIKKLDFIIVFAVALVGIVVGSFLDLQISQNLYFPSNTFGIVLAALGEAPGYAAFSFCSIIALLLGIKNYHRWYQKAILILFGVAGIALSIYFLSDHIVCKDGFNIPSLWFIGVLIAILTNGVGVLFGIYIYKNSDPNYILRYLLTLAIIIVVGIVMVQVVKSIMQRPRYRFLISEEGSLEYFKNWWQRGNDIKGAFTTIGSDEFKSFPSGHTNVGALLIPVLAYLPTMCSKIKINARILFYGAFAYTIILAFSRITVAAHFLSDVCFGLLITMLVYWAFDFILVRHDKTWNVIARIFKQKEIVEQ